MPTEILARAKPKPWPGQISTWSALAMSVAARYPIRQATAHLLAMMAAVGAIAMSKRLVVLAKRLDPEL